MADAKISELATAGALDGSELVETVQGGVNVKTTTQDIANLGAAGSVSSVNGDAGPAVSLDAGDIPNTPTGGIVATNVQAAINELDTEKEYVANKATDFSTLNNTLYPSVQAVEDRILAATAGLKWKASARVATTTAGTLASDFENGDTVDGVVLATGNRILIKNQADQTTNGIYTVNASGAPTRSTDADIAVELESAAISVQEGTSNANTTWLQTTDSITLGVSNIVWSAFGSSVPDADATTKGIARLYPSTSLGSNTDGAPDQNAVKTYVDTKVSDTAYGSGWNGDTTIAPSKNAVYDKIETILTSNLNTYRTETATHDLDATDLANINAGVQLVIRLNAASALDLEIPTNANQAFPTGTIIGWEQTGAGQVTIVPLSGVTLRSPNSANKSYAQYSRGYIEKVGTNEWVLSGDITP